MHAPHEDLLRKLLSVPTTLYWAGPQPRYCPTATSWVWLSAPSPLMACFPTREAAETAAHTFAGAHWHSGFITVAFVELPQRESTLGSIHESTAESGQAALQQET